MIIGETKKKLKKETVDTDTRYNVHGRIEKNGEDFVIS
jgi:hypothetical protein